MRFPAAFNSPDSLAAFVCFLIALISLSRMKPEATMPLELPHINEPTMALPPTDERTAFTPREVSSSSAVSGGVSYGTKTSSSVQVAKTPSTGVPEIFILRSKSARLFLGEFCLDAASLEFDRPNADFQRRLHGASFPELLVDGFIYLDLLRIRLHVFCKKCPHFSYCAFCSLPAR